MSGLYAVAIARALLWLVITWLLWKIGRYFFTNRALRLSLAIMGGLLLLSLAFWTEGGKDGLFSILGVLVFTWPLPFIGGWLWLTYLMWKGSRRLLASGFANQTVRVALVVAVALLWLGGTFWEVAGKKMYWDAKVRKLCAIDGGVKVYETVELPAEKFDKWGNVQIPSRSNAKIKDDYFYERDTTTIRDGNSESGSLEIWKSTFRVVRKSDDKVLGTATSYSRRGGDFPGPWHPSSFGCPPKSDITDLEKQLFFK